MDASAGCLDFMRQAVRLAELGVSRGEGGPFGAVVVLHGKVIGEGFNRVLATNDPTAHAEIVALRAACASVAGFHLVGAELYSSCEPCPMCLCAALWARVGRVYFAADRHDAALAGFDDVAFYDELSKAPEERRMPLERLRVEGAHRAFSLWKKQPGATRY